MSHSWRWLPDIWSWRGMRDLWLKLSREGSSWHQGRSLLPIMSDQDKTWNPLFFSFFPLLCNWKDISISLSPVLSRVTRQPAGFVTKDSTLPNTGGLLFLPVTNSSSIPNASANYDQHHPLNLEVSQQLQLLWSEHQVLFLSFSNYNTYPARHNHLHNFSSFAPRHSHDYLDESAPTH